VQCSAEDGEMMQEPDSFPNTLGKEHPLVPFSSPGSHGHHGPCRMHKHRIRPSIVSALDCVSENTVLKSDYLSFVARPQGKQTRLPLLADTGVQDALSFTADVSFEGIDLLRPRKSASGEESPWEQKFELYDGLLMRALIPCSSASAWCSVAASVFHIRHQRRCMVIFSVTMS
jgi:hypothetical protein